MWFNNNNYYNIPNITLNFIAVRYHIEIFDEFIRAMMNFIFPSNHTVHILPMMRCILNGR